MKALKKKKFYWRNFGLHYENSCEEGEIFLNDFELWGNLKEILNGGDFWTGVILGKLWTKPSPGFFLSFYGSIQNFFFKDQCLSCSQKKPHEPGFFTKHVRTQNSIRDFMWFFPEAKPSGSSEKRRSCNSCHFQNIEHDLWCVEQEYQQSDHMILRGLVCFFLRNLAWFFYWKNVWPEFPFIFYSFHFVILSDFQKKWFTWSYVILCGSACYVFVKKLCINAWGKKCCQTKKQMKCKWTWLQGSLPVCMCTCASMYTRYQSTQPKNHKINFGILVILIE